MKTNEEFIMLPTVDFCFKRLMENPKVRQGFVAALLKIEPRFVQETELLPTSTDNDFPDDKLGILDVRIRLVTGRRWIWRCRCDILNTGMNGQCSILARCLPAR